MWFAYNAGMHYDKEVIYLELSILLMACDWLVYVEIFENIQWFRRFRNTLQNSLVKK